MQKGMAYHPARHGKQITISKHFGGQWDKVIWFTIEEFGQSCMSY